MFSLVRRIISGIIPLVACAVVFMYLPVAINFVNGWHVEGSMETVSQDKFQETHAVVKDKATEKAKEAVAKSKVEAKEARERLK